MIKIAIDGYSGSGKSTLSDGLAKKLKLKHLSTGSILRAMGLYFEELGNTNPSKEDVESHLAKMDIKIDFEGDKQKTFLNGRDVTEAISAETIGQMASKIAVIVPAMQKLIEVSRAFAEKYDCVMDGRNITSEVLPDADVKIFLDADVSARAARRHKEATEKQQKSNLNDVMSSLKERDFRDSHRDNSPLKLVSDAILVDNTNMSLDETVEYVYKLICDKLRDTHKLDGRL